MRIEKETRNAILGLGALTTAVTSGAFISGQSERDKYTFPQILADNGRKEINEVLLREILEKPKKTRKPEFSRGALINEELLKNLLDRDKNKNEETRTTEEEKEDSQTTEGTDENTNKINYTPITVFGIIDSTTDQKEIRINLGNITYSTENPFDRQLSELLNAYNENEAERKVRYLLDEENFASTNDRINAGTETLEIKLGRLSVSLDKLGIELTFDNYDESIRKVISNLEAYRKELGCKILLEYKEDIDKIFGSEVYSRKINKLQPAQATDEQISKFNAIKSRCNLG